MTGDNSTEIGSSTKWTEAEFSYGQTEGNTLENTEKTKRNDMVSSNGKIRENTSDIGVIERSIEKESFSIQKRIVGGSECGMTERG